MGPGPALFLRDLRREREREGRKVATVEKILDNDEEGAGLLHNSTKQSPWREGAQTLEGVFEDAQPLNRVEVKKTVEGAFDRWRRQNKGWTTSRGKKERCRN